jgi:hypothetical protein
MEVLHSSKSSVLTRATWLNIPEDGILHSHRSETLKSKRDCCPPATFLSWLCPMQLFSVSPIEDTTILSQLRQLRQNQRWCWTHHRTASRMHLKHSKALGTVHTCGSRLLKGWLRSVGPKLHLDHMAAPVPKIMDTSGTQHNKCGLGTVKPKLN